MPLFGARRFESLLAENPARGAASRFSSVVFHLLLFMAVKRKQCLFETMQFFWPMKTVTKSLRTKPSRLKGVNAWFPRRTYENMRGEKSLRMSSEYDDFYDVFPERDYRRHDTSKILLLIIIGVLASFLILVSLYHVDLQSRYLRLEENYLELDSELSGLKSLRDELLLRVSQLEKEVSFMRESYDNLLLQYQVSEALRINHLLEDYYDEVRSLKDIPPRRGRNPDYVQQVRFMAELAKHSLGRTYWPALEERFYELSGEHSYAAASRKMDEVFKLIGVKDSDTPVERIEKILRFINNNIRYEHDYDDVFLAPLETLAFRSGDCDDYAILAAALFDKAGIDSAIGVFTNGTIEHAMVLVHLDTLSPYGFHYYQDLTHMGLASGRWILIEPQATIDRQYDKGWFNQWRLLAAAEV